MYLSQALDVASADDLDPACSLFVGGLELGSEATTEAIRILAGGDFCREVECVARRFADPFYWSITHKVNGNAEVFGFPAGAKGGLPTAVEIGLVRAIAAADPKHHSEILNGGTEIALGSPNVYHQFRRVLEVVGPPLSGKSVLYGDATQATINHDADARLTRIVINCLANSFHTSPIKFRFLEIYRMIEARFLAEIKTKLLANFDAEPSFALSNALEALKSEMSQITDLAETEQDAFEACWKELDQLKNTNQFATALFRRVKEKGAAGDKWKTGAALVYQIRCAVVHAGERGMIFENFPDGEDVINAVIPHVERAALRLVGIELS